MLRSRGWLAIVAVASFTLGGGVLSAGCVGGSKGLSSSDKDRLKAYVLDAPPADMPHKLDVNFENKVHLIGYKFEPELAKPGEEAKVTYWWRCDDTLDDGWVLFTHTRDEGNGKLGNLDYDGPIRENRNGHQVLGPEHWEKGKVYVDEQTYHVPNDVVGSEVTFLVGVWKGDARLRIISGPNDGDNSAIVGKLKTGVVQQAKEEHTTNDVPQLSVPKLAPGAKITVDGKATEAEWATAASTPAFVDVGTGKPNVVFPVNGSAKMMWDDKNLYVLVTVNEAEPYVGFTDAKAQPSDFTAGGQPKLWTKDTIEMMVDPGPAGDNKTYYELQINPQNKIFKSQFDALQLPNGGPNGPFGHEDWDPKLKSAVALQKGADGKVSGYTVEAAIPWTAYAKASPQPPNPGDVWRVNFYAMKNNGGVAWSPILGQGNFHKASRFGKVTWSATGASSATGPSDAGARGAMAAMRGDGGMRMMRVPHPGIPTPPATP
ncbi:MAG TPA: carbohydrate-binding family 9-like protein [Polyangiaceae bacterium]|nr:carbohydrate-binding family 9-like protein [Polyangiaceae bacterium]